MEASGKHDQADDALSASAPRPRRLDRAQVPLESVITTVELERRPARAPDYEAESRALGDLMDAMAAASGSGPADGILRKLADAALILCRAGSAGVSVLENEDEREVFRWRAAAGQWARFLGGSMARDSSPCGAVLDRDRPLLMSHPERHYQYGADAPPIVEALLIPFHHEGKPVGTVWVIAHDEARRFDAEDQRLMTRLSRFAASTYQFMVAQELRKTLAEQQLLDKRLAADLDRLRRAEEALREADRRKDAFLATLAHELRNPLAPIRNALQILGTNTPSADLQWGRDLIDRQTRQMTRLIDDLLDVSRITRDKLELRKEGTELSRVVAGAVETSRPLLDQMGHELKVTLPPEPVVLDADPMRLAQVFSNLLNNAAKFSQRGGRVILDGERRGDEVLVSVRDHGIGIEEAVLPHVFDMFSQFGSSGEGGRSGLGIGLTLVKRLVELHGGSVTAFSEGRGKGSEFVVRLPVVASSADAPAKSDERPIDAPAKRRILIVDDNADAAESLGRVLETLGYETRTASDGVEGLAAMADFSPDVAILDIGMPKMDGFELARHIRERNGGMDVALIAMTGWGQAADRERTSEAGFDDHLVKPVEPTALARRLAAILSR